MTVQLYGVTITEISTLPKLPHCGHRGYQVCPEDHELRRQQNATKLEVQTFALSFLRQHGVPAQTALPTTTGKLLSMEEIDCGHGAQTYCVRLMTFLPGKTLAESPGTMQDLYHVGRLIAFMDKTLQKVSGKVKLVSFHIFLIHMQLF
ncbi:hypothetical protein F7725_027218 [Dissostichus mawsoni]|uniref:Aminoglycoside phosphotransferase domain-containing protein n=1 Tax=Dissostichus mawsoni TaxID=36200 RepID=A0A7J5XCC8_DISMA|nr:hypothetical protein F7725_027218 [Dissostichus mawsoni]